VEPDRTQLDYPPLTLRPTPQSNGSLGGQNWAWNVTSGPFGLDRYFMMDSQPGF
jgi:hypothetical protein